MGVGGNWRKNPSVTVQLCVEVLTVTLQLDSYYRRHLNNQLTRVAIVEFIQSTLLSNSTYQIFYPKVLLSNPIFRTPLRTPSYTQHIQSLFLILEMTHPEVITLSPLDELATRRYTIKLLCFPLRNANTSSATQALKQGLADTLQSVPLLTGTIQARVDTSGREILQVTAPWHSIDEIFRINHLLETDELDYDVLKRKHFPMSPLEVITLTSLTVWDGLGKPALQAQANFVRGGMILALILNHSIMDGMGSFEISKLWAANCRGDSIPIPVIDSRRISVNLPAKANFDGIAGCTYLPTQNPSGHSKDGISWPGLYRRLQPLFHSLTYPFSWVMDAAGWHSSRRLNPTSLDTVPLSPNKYPTDEEMKTEIFYFSHKNLHELKTLATKSAFAKDPSAWISTNDALSALLWCCVSAARKHAANDQLTFVRVVNSRRILRLPPNYIGNSWVFSPISAPAAEVTSTRDQVSHLPYFLRKALKHVDEDFIRNLVACIKALPSPKPLMSTYAFSPGHYFMLSSWTDQRFCDLDWGTTIDVKCERVRVPKIGVGLLDGVGIVLPWPGGSDDGVNRHGLEVLLSLKGEVMDRLRDDELFKEYATWRCS